MADAGLGHDGDAHHFHDALDDGGVGHAGDAAGGADVGRDAFKGHDGAGAGFFGDLRLFGGGHVHDDATLEHFCKTGLQANGALFHIFYSLRHRRAVRWLRGAVSGQKGLICHIVASDNNYTQTGCFSGRLRLSACCPHFGRGPGRPVRRRRTGCRGSTPARPSAVIGGPPALTAFPARALLRAGAAAVREGRLWPCNGVPLWRMLKTPA